jgi:DHA1 family bicyclomycin/chloramphenicol resistance-like MFS transporter
VGLTVFVVASLLIMVAPSLGILVLLRLVQALGGSAGIVIARAVVRDLYSGTELARAMSAIVTVFALAPVVAPLLGSAIILVAPWPWMFAALALFGVLCLIGVWRMPETLPADRRTDHGFVGAVRQYGVIIGNREFRYAAAIAALGSMALFTYISGSPAVLMDSYGLSEGGFALSFAALSLCFALGAQLNMRLLKRYRVITLLRSSVATQVTASMVVLVVGVLSLSLPFLMIPLVIALMTVAGVNSNAMALALDPFPRSAASAAALVGGLQMTMGAVASAVFSAMTLRPPVEMGLGMTVAGLVSVSLIALSMRRVAPVPQSTQ